MDAVPQAVLDHWHEKPLVVDIIVASARSPAAATTPVQNQKERSSPVFSPDRLEDPSENDIAGAGRESSEREAETESDEERRRDRDSQPDRARAPTVHFNERPVVLGFSPISVATSRDDLTEISHDRSPMAAQVSPAPPQRRPPSQAVRWLAAITVQRAYRRRARRVVMADERARRSVSAGQRSSLGLRSFSLQTGSALARQREARRAAALRAVARQQAHEPKRGQPVAHSRLLDAPIRSSSCNVGPLTGCSSRTLVEAHFDSGPLGLRIAEYARPGRGGELLRVEEIQPGSAAAAVPDLRVGMTLLQINGADVRYSGYTCGTEAKDGSSSRWRIGKGSSSSSSSTTASWFATVMERMAQRPLTLVFVADQPSARLTQSAPIPFTVNAVSQQQGSQLSPTSAMDATSPPPPSPGGRYDSAVASSVECEYEGSASSSSPSDSARQIRPRKPASGCCAARPPHSRGQ